MNKEDRSTVFLRKGYRPRPAQGNYFCHFGKALSFEQQAAEAAEAARALGFLHSGRFPGGRRGVCLVCPLIAPPYRAMAAFWGFGGEAGGESGLFPSF